MVRFYKAVDKRSRSAMINYLSKHFRYCTLNSWNLSTSYACNMKIHNLGLEAEIADKLYDLIQVHEFNGLLDDLIHEFGEAHNFNWQAGFNGRSGGYLVLYQGEKKPSGYKSFCTACGQQNYKSVEETGCVCGRCRQQTRKDYLQTHMRVSTFPGRSTDQNECFEDWSTYDLQRRVELVQEFDKLADAIVDEAVFIASNYEVKEEIVYVPHTQFVMASSQ